MVHVVQLLLTKTDRSAKEVESGAGSTHVRDSITVTLTRHTHSNQMLKSLSRSRSRGPPIAASSAFDAEAMLQLKSLFLGRCGEDITKRRRINKGGWSGHLSSNP